MHKLFKRDHHKGQRYHEKQISLYAEYDRPNLLPFLRDSTHCPLEKVRHRLLDLYTSEVIIAKPFVIFVHPRSRERLLLPKLKFCWAVLMRTNPFKLDFSEELKHLCDRLNWNKGLMSIPELSNHHTKVKLRV